MEINKMSKQIVYSMPDGNVYKDVPSRSIGDEDLTDDEIIIRAVLKVPSEATNIDIKDVSTLSDRTFRDAWTMINTDVHVNMDKARLIHMNQIRKVRNEKLKEISGSEKRPRPEIEALFPEQVRTELQTLRDIPQVFDLTSAITPEELMMLWPAELL
jgi:hypothetical protein